MIIKVGLIFIKIQVRKTIQIPAFDGADIVIEQVRLGSSLCWHLHHGKRRMITKSKQKISKYIQQHRKNKTSYEIIDLGEY